MRCGREMALVRLIGRGTTGRRRFRPKARMEVVLAVGSSAKGQAEMAEPPIEFGSFSDLFWKERVRNRAISLG